MTKTELVAAVAEAAGLSKKDAEAAVSATFNTITQAMVKGDKVQLMGFGAFVPKDRPARTCINPVTKSKIQVAATRVPTFKAGKALKDAVAK